MPYSIVTTEPVAPMGVIAVAVQIFADNPGTDVPLSQSVSSQKILLGNIVLFAQSAPVILVDSLTAGGRNAGFLLVLPPPANPETQALLYSFGGVVLTYQFTLDGGPAIFSTNFVLPVVPTTPSSSWWSWTQPPTSQVSWKTAYSPAGTFVNTSSSATIQSGMLSLQEYDYLANTTTTVAQQALPQTDPTDNFGITFPQITKSWTWYDPPPTDDVIGPYSKVYGYTINADLMDQAGNQFSLVSSSISITVQVSSAKQAAAIGANSAALIAIGLTIAAGLVGIFSLGTATAAAAALGVAAAALVGTAALLQTTASDPPEPNFAFARPVRIKYLTIEFGTALSDHPAALVINTASRLAVLINSLSKIEGKILGARIRNNQPALRMQMLLYRKVLMTLVADLSKLSAAQDGLLQLPLDKQFFGGVDGASFVQCADSIADHGLSAEQEQRLLRAGFAEATISQMVTAIKSRSFKQFIAKYKDDLAHPIRVLAVAAGHAAWEALIYARTLDLAVMTVPTRRVGTRRKRPVRENLGA